MYHIPCEVYTKNFLYLQPGERNFLLLSSKSGLNYYKFTEGDLKVKFLIASPSFKKLNPVNLAINSNELQVLVVEQSDPLFLPDFDYRGYSQEILKSKIELLEGRTVDYCNKSKLIAIMLARQEAYFGLAGTLLDYPLDGSIGTPYYPNFLNNLDPLEKKRLSEFWVLREGVYSLRLKVSHNYEIHISYKVNSDRYQGHNAKGLQKLFQGLSVLDSKQFNNSFICAGNKKIYIPELSMRVKSYAILTCDGETGPNRKLIRPVEAVLKEKYGIDPVVQYRINEKMEAIQSRLSKHKIYLENNDFYFKGVQISEKK